MPFNLLQRLRSVNRKLIIVSCLVYLSLVFLFHGRLEFEQQLDNRFKNSIFKKKSSSGVVYFHQKNHSKSIIQKSLLLSRESNVKVHPANITIKPIQPQFHSPSVNYNKNAITTSLPLDRNCYLSAYNVANNTFHRISDGIFIYSAYLDDRHIGKFVRVMAIIAQRKQKLRFFCHFPGSRWTDVIVYQMCENHNKHFGGYIMSCPLPSSKHGQQNACFVTISLQNKPITDENLFIPITRIQPEEKLFEYGICIPPLFGDISKEHLVEYIELSKLLGVQHFFFYNFRLSEAATRVLEYYEKQNTVTIIPWKLPNEVHDNSIWYNGQLIAHNDCLYRSMSLVKMTAFNDLDEFIIPHNGTTLTDFVSKLTAENICGFSFWSAFFDPSTGRPHPSGLFTMSQTGRSAKFSQVRTKVLVEPQKIFEVGIHHVSKPNEEHYKMLRVDTDIAFLHHYRKCVSNYGMKCDKFIPDRTIYKYFDDLKDAFDLQLKLIHQINSTA